MCWAKEAPDEAEVWDLGVALRLEPGSQRGPQVFNVPVQAGWPLPKLPIRVSGCGEVLLGSADGERAN